MYMALITGVKQFIVLHKMDKKLVQLSTILDTIEKTVMETHSVEQIEKACFSPSVSNEPLNVLKIDTIIINTNKLARFLVIIGR